MIRKFAYGQEERSSIPGRVILKTQKMVHDASLFITQYDKVRIRSKRYYTLWCSSCWKGAFGSPSTTVGQLSCIYIYIYITSGKQYTHQSLSMLRNRVHRMTLYILYISRNHSLMINLPYFFNYIFSFFLSKLFHDLCSRISGERFVCRANSDPADSKFTCCSDNCWGDKRTVTKYC